MPPAEPLNYGASAKKLADDLLASLPAAHSKQPGCGVSGSGAAAPAPAPAGKVTKAFVPSKVIKNRYQAIVELAVAWRERQGWAPGVSEPSAELCAARELLGECTVDGCVRCKSGVRAPKDLVDGVLARCTEG